IVITISVDPEEGGVTTGSVIYEIGDTVTITSTASDGYAFVAWMENGTLVSTQANYSFIGTGDRNLIAKFTPLIQGDQYLITTLIEPQEGGEALGGGYYDPGDT